MATLSATGTHDYVAEISGLVPKIRQLGGEIERERRLPRELVEDFRNLGLFHLLLPRDFGGEECDPVTAARVVEEAAFGDGSAGWCLMIANQTVGLAGLLPPDEARTIHRNRAIVAGVARPIGKAVATNTPEPGYIVSGRWPFASGSSHADWFGAECVVYDGDQPRKDADGNDVTRLTYVPANQVTIHDTWDTTGLRGTASNDFSVDGAFVPAPRGFQMLVTQPQHSWALYRATPLVFINHGAQALGVARATIESVKEAAPRKPGWGTDRPMSEHARLQAALAEAVVAVEAARTFLYSTSTELWEAVQPEGAEGTPLQRSRVRLANSHAVRSAVHAGDLMHGIMGTTAIFATSPLERQFRDLRTAAAHVMIGPLTMEAAGRVELGLEAAFPFF